MESKEMLALAAEVGEGLRGKGLNLGVAESCTGGRLAALITAVPGSSDYFLGGVVAYHNRVKRRALKIPAGRLRRFGAVSPETAAAMAGNIRKVTGGRIGLSITGIAGPAGGSPEKPVGLVYLGFSTRKVRKVFECRFPGTREEIRRQACLEALEILRDYLADGPRFQAAPNAGKRP
ncbi:MAG TPA: CinA family protein [bacterium]|nr:CinA family protein [bacterium]HNS48562.1 CinA family protein [bacterium]